MGESCSAEDVEQTIGYYSDDAIVLPPNATGAATKEAIRTSGNMFASPSLVISWHRPECRSAIRPEMAWVRGRYELTMNDASGKPIDDRGKIPQSGKNKLMEIGNVPRHVEFRSRSVAPALLRKISRSPSLLCRPEDHQLYAKSETDLNELGNAHAIGQFATVCIGVPSVIYFAIELREQTDAVSRR